MKLLSKLPIDGFIAAILATVALACVLPASGSAYSVAENVSKVAIGVLFLLYGIRLSPQEALAGLRNWRLHGVVLAFTFLLFPLIGLALRLLEPAVLSPQLYTGVLFLCLVPSTVQSSIAFTSIARGNTAGAIVSASFSNLAGVFLTPALVLLLMGASGHIRFETGMIVDIVVQLLLPFVVGQLIRKWTFGLVSRYPAATKLVDRGSILIVVYTAFSAGMNEHIFSELSPLRILVVMVVCAAVLAVVLAATHFGGKLLGFDRGDRIVILFCGSKKSLASGLPMASVLFTGQPVGLIVLPLMIFHQIQLMTCAVLAARLGRTAEEAEQQLASV